MGLCGVTLTVLTYSTFSYITSTPVIPDHSLLSVTNLVNVATFTHCIACLFEDNFERVCRLFHGKCRAVSKYSTL